jgi:hypothetical protein
MITNKTKAAIASLSTKVVAERNVDSVSSTLLEIFMTKVDRSASLVSKLSEFSRHAYTFKFSVVVEQASVVSSLTLHGCKVTSKSELVTNMTCATHSKLGVDYYEDLTVSGGTDSESRIIVVTLHNK